MPKLQHQVYGCHKSDFCDRLTNYIGKNNRQFYLISNDRGREGKPEVDLWFIRTIDKFHAMRRGQFLLENREELPHS